ncbi:MAG: hypothetical protein ABH839_00925 [Chloroflexota bacterium]
MNTLTYVAKWGWGPALITALAIVGSLYQWPILVLGPILVILLIIGLIVAAIGSKEKELELKAQRLRQLAGYFNRRFTGNSSLSIFAIIDSLFNIDNPKIWEWAQACDMSQRIFNTWYSSFITRVESDIRTRRLDAYLATCLNELWLANNHYYELVEQFYQISESFELPPETVGLYNRFTVEYNTFVQEFRDNISELRKSTRTGIEPPSVKLARELVVATP